MPEKTELNPCPFCGGCTFQIMKPFYAFVRCVDCVAEGPPKDTEAGAITAWNTRAGEGV